MTSRNEWTAGVLFGLALLLCLVLYRPGLTGSFQFDDYSNLSTLEALNSNPTSDQFAQFMLKGISSPLGRPISLLSFAMQSSDWPERPGAFIRVNILLHLINGALLFWWLLRLTRLTSGPGPARLYVPLGATFLWLFAPIQASSVLYVVQRMTELSATFVFLGMGIYLAGREALLQGAQRAGLIWMSMGLAVGAGLGTLAKENAAQMPFMVLALEFTLLACLPRPRAWRLWAAPFLILPALAVLAYVAWIAIHARGYDGRDFTPLERLLTEPRVLFMYLHKIITPWPSAVRLWYDDFPHSTGLFAPWTTAIALIGLAGVAGIAWKLRTAAPLFAFAVLWFLSCHVLESTGLPLELVFEHRNYQASAGIWFALAAGAAFVLDQASSVRARQVFVVLGASFLLLQASVTWQIATMWGRPLELSAWMAARLPDSKRAAQSFIGTLMRERLPFDAAMAAEKSTRRWPDDPSFPLLTLMLSCQFEQVPFPATADLMHRLRTTPGNVHAVVDYTDAVVSLLESHHCPIGLPFPLAGLTGSALSNRALQPQRQNLLLLHSRALKVENRGDESREVFRQAIDARPQMILLIQGALDAVVAGDLALAKRYLQRAHSDPRIKWRDRWVHRNDIVLLEELVRSREGAATQ